MIKSGVVVVFFVFFPQLSQDPRAGGLLVATMLRYGCKNKSVSLGLPYYQYSC